MSLSVLRRTGQNFNHGYPLQTYQITSTVLVGIETIYFSFHTSMKNICELMSNTLHYMPSTCLSITPDENNLL